MTNRPIDKSPNPSRPPCRVRSVFSHKAPFGPMNGLPK
jgi:hypothetical protein